MGVNKRKARLVGLSSIVHFQGRAPGQTRRAMPGIIGGRQRCPVGDFGSPEAGFLRGLDVVAIGSWSPHHPRQSRLTKTRINAGHMSQ